MNRPTKTNPNPHRSHAATITGFLLLLTFATAAHGQVDCSGIVTGSGTATYYEYTPNSGGCNYTNEVGTRFVAMNPVDYEGSAMCGRYIRVTGPLGSVDVKVVDMFPPGLVGDIDLNRPAFEQIAGIGQNAVAVTWETIADPVSGPLSIYIKDGSNQWWLGIQVMDHRYGIVSVEYLAPSGYVATSRQSYNFFVMEAGMGGTSSLDDPFDLRVTDVNGQSLVVTDIPLLPGAVFTSSVQFPDCVGVSATPPSNPYSGFVLHDPVPNPFNPQTTIAFEIPGPESVTVGVFDISGRLVKKLVDGESLGSGRHELSWNGRDSNHRQVAAGLYFYRLDAGSYSETKRMVLVK